MGASDDAETGRLFEAWLATDPRTETRRDLLRAAWDAGRAAYPMSPGLKLELTIILDRLVAAHEPGGRPMSAHDVCKDARGALALVRGEVPALTKFSSLTAAESLVYAIVFGATVTVGGAERAKLRAAEAVLALRRAEDRNPNAYEDAMLRRFKEGQP